MNDLLDRFVIPVRNTFIVCVMISLVFSFITKFFLNIYVFDIAFAISMSMALLISYLYNSRKWSVAEDYGMKFIINIETPVILAVYIFIVVTATFVIHRFI